MGSEKDLSRQRRDSRLGGGNVLLIPSPSAPSEVCIFVRERPDCGIDGLLLL